jgi:hypothetical protein
VIGEVSASGAINTTTSTTSFSGNNIRAVTSVDGTSFWAVGATIDVVYTPLGGSGAGTVVSSSETNLRAVDIDEGQLYVSTASGSFKGVNIVGAITPNTTGQTTTLLSGLGTATPSTYNFFFAQLNPSDPGVDTLYVADNTNGIEKFTLIDGTWTQNGTAAGTAADGYDGLTGTVSGTTVTLYATTNTGNLVSFTDTAGYNAAMSSTTPTTLATAATNEAFRGIAFAPQALTSTITTVTGNTPANPGDTVTLTATVQSGGVTDTAATGTVTFKDATSSAPVDLGTVAVIDGQASLPLTTLATGTHAIVAVYSGDSIAAAATYGGSISNPFSEVINGPFAPSFTGGNNIEFTAGSFNTFTVTATGNPTPTFTETGNLPSGVTLSTAGVLSGTPSAIAQTQDYPITITATNSAGAPTLSFVLYVVPAVTTPVPFTPGDLVVFRVGDGGVTYGSAGTGGSASGVSAGVFLDEYKTNGTFVQTIFVPSQNASGTLADSDSINATSEGMLTLSADGQLIAFTGYNAVPGTANITSTSSSVVPRVIGTVNAAGVVTLDTSTTAYSANNIRSAATVDGLEFWTAGASATGVAGVNYFNTVGTANGTGTGITDTANTRTVDIIDGQLYFGTGVETGNSGTGIYATSTPLPTAAAGGTDTSLQGASASPYQFVILDMNGDAILYP